MFTSSCFCCLCCEYVSLVSGAALYEFCFDASSLSTKPQAHGVDVGVDAEGGVGMEGEMEELVKGEEGGKEGKRSERERMG